MARAPPLAAFAALLLVAAGPGPAPSAAADSAPDELSAPAFGYVVERYVYVANRFGERIAVDLYRPAVDGAPAPGAWPLLVESSAYRHWVTPQPTQADEAKRTFWAERGYTYAFVDVPGSGGSEGQWCLLCAREAESTADVVDWLAGQPWSDGNVSLVGNSYAGILALLVAAQEPPSVRAVAAGYAYADLYRDFAHVGGLDRFLDAASLAAAFTGLDAWSGPAFAPRGAEDVAFLVDVWGRRAASPPPTWVADWTLPATDGPYWRERSPAAYADRIHAPLLITGGFNDLFDRGVAENFRLAASPHKFLRMTPTTHLPLVVPDATWDLPERAPGEGGFALPVPGALAWFDHWLKGKDTPEWRSLASARVRYFEQDANRWRAADAWPPADARDLLLYLRSGPDGAGLLAPEPPGGAEPSDRFHHEPAAGATSGQTFWRVVTPDPDHPERYLFPDGPGDQRAEERLGLAYTSAPLAADLEVTGSPRLVLYAATTATDADWVVRLTHVSPRGTPDGFSHLVTSGWLRASHRDSHETPTPVAPGAVVRYEVELWPTSYRFAAGDRLRLDVLSSDAPRFLPNAQAAEHAVDHSMLHPSVLALPVRPAPA